MADQKIKNHIKKMALLSFLSLSSTFALSEPVNMSTVPGDTTPLMETAKKYGIQAGNLNQLAQSMGDGKPVDGIYLPAGGFFVIQGNDGSLTTISGTGRYAVNGSLYDVVKKTNITTVKQLRDSTLIKLSDTPFPLNEVSSISFGNPSLPRQGALFITIDCSGCQDLMKSLYQHRSELNLQIVLLPSVGNSAKLVRQIWCARNERKLTDFEIIKWLVNREEFPIENKLVSYEEAAKKCDVTPIVASTVIAQIYNLQGVPSTVREDGFVTNGFPTDFKAWLKQDISPIYANPFKEIDKLNK